MVVLGIIYCVKTLKKMRKLAKEAPAFQEEPMDASAENQA